MRRKLYITTYDAIAEECIHTGHVPAAEVLNDADRCPDCLRQAVAAVLAVLGTLAEEHFPDEDIDYHYACEGLAEDVNDVLAAIRGEG